MKEMARLLHQYADRSGLQKIAMRAAMIFPSLMLKDTMRLLKENSQMPLKSIDTVEGKPVAKILQKKHPEGRPQILQLYPKGMLSLNSSLL